MIEMTLTAKNQFTFNKSLLEHLGVKAGEKIAIKKLPDGSININASKKHRSVMDLAGALKGKTDVKMTIEQINQAIADGYVEHGMRGMK
ncbi:MAG: type II toxin-antitoxin system PrlF family antitoxin [Betaproteobacteria bacterium]|nr:type II toxin-antitoxin system PrlF family antitoxin [Betaproteobacteria bacterium]MCL2887099.1 type II toxin-antitoxin system PrlF family antitoxin [Betaproteobacteria bacterium]